MATGGTGSGSSPAELLASAGGTGFGQPGEASRPPASRDPGLAGDQHQLAGDLPRLQLLKGRGGLG